MKHSETFPQARAFLRGPREALARGLGFSALAGLSMLLGSAGVGCSGSIESSNPGAANPNAPGVPGTGTGPDTQVGPDGQPLPPGVDPVTPGTPGSNVGLVGLRRLNRTEYNNTVADLLGTTSRPAEAFPADDLLYGFDNIGQALAVSTLHIERYETAAHNLARELLAKPATDPFRARVMVCDVAAEGASCADKIFAAFAPRAWRRPVAADELARYSALYQAAVTQTATPEDAVALGLGAMLSSPHFVFMVELDPDPNSTVKHPLNDFELASRLSYFLWSSMPDDTLSGLAAQGALQTDATLVEQAMRLFDDGKASAFLQNMSGLWLQARKLSITTPNADFFPDWEPELGAAMQEETKLFFQEFVKNPLPVDQMLTAPFAFLNQRLAEHYGIPGVTGDQFRRVELGAGSNRLGLLTQGGFLTLTSMPTRTAPVIRGKWVLEQLLCASPPPPPDGVPKLEDQPDLEGLSVRERLEKHKDLASTCYGCHSTMDPIGLGLENYDAVGAYREMDGDDPVDASGELPGTPPQAFNGALELAQLIAQDPRFVPCVAQQTATYATGARPDLATAQAIALNAAAAGTPTVRSIVESVVKSDVFRQRHASDPAAVAGVGGTQP